MAEQCPKCGGVVITDFHCWKYCINADCDYHDIDWDEWKRHEDKAYKLEVQIDEN